MVALLVLAAVAVVVWATKRRGRGPDYASGLCCTRAHEVTFRGFVTAQRDLEAAQQAVLLPNFSDFCAMLCSSESQRPSRRLLERIVSEWCHKESLATGIPGTPYQSGLLQLRYYVAEYTVAHSCFRFLSGKAVKLHNWTKSARQQLEDSLTTRSKSI